MEQEAKWSLGAAAIVVVGLIAYVMINKKEKKAPVEKAPVAPVVPVVQKRGNPNVAEQPVDLGYYKIMTPVQLNALDCDTLSNHYSMLNRQYMYLLSEGQAPYKGYVDKKGAVWNNSDSIGLRKHMEEVMQVMGSKSCSIMRAI